MGKDIAAGVRKSQAAAALAALSLLLALPAGGQAASVWRSQTSDVRPPTPAVELQTANPGDPSLQRSRGLGTASVGDDKGGGAVGENGGTGGDEQAAPKVRVEHYKIDVTLRPEQSFLRARAEVTVRAPEDAKEAIRAVEFELNPRLEIDAITDAQNRRLEWQRSGRIGSASLLVQLAEPLAAGQQTTLTFSYRGSLLLYGSLDYFSSEGVLLRDESRWYPAVDLSAFATHEITIRVPPGWSSVAGGTRSVISAPVTTWQAEMAIPSRAFVAYPSAGNNGGGSQGLLVPSVDATTTHFSISVTHPLESDELADEISKKMLDIAAEYVDILGPRERFGLKLVWGFPGQRGAIGYSGPGFLVASDEVWKWHAHPGYAPTFLAHEIAHQWFPLQVTMASPADAWLAEGLAEYLAWRYLEEKAPAVARAEIERAYRDALEDDPYPLNVGLHLVGREDWDVVRRTLYDRGALVWRTLEATIGRQRVDAALQEYYKRFQGRSASVADFRKIAEEIARRDIGWFFDYFMTGKEFPELELRRLPPTAPGEYAGEIILGNVPPEFTVRVEMQLYTSEGVVEHSVATRGERTPFTVNVSGAVSRVELDPHRRILRWTEPARRHLRQQALLENLGDYERQHQYTRGLRACEDALAADPDDLARHHQKIRFLMGRLLLRRGLADQALEEFGRALNLTSMSATDTEFYAAWSRVYRARIHRSRARRDLARIEAQAGLAKDSPALDVPVTWLDTPVRTMSARQELERLAR